MDELPELLVEAVGGTTVIETVAIGGGDFVAVTPGETHLYRSEGLLSDESLETFAHDVDRFAVEDGRRKSSILLQTIDEESSFTVPSSVVEDVVEAMLEGVLRTAGTVGDGERVEAQFRFSELTLVVTDEQLLKHVGGAVWNDEFEAFHYGDLTGLDFEEGSVATQVVVETNDRQQRVKVPNENAGRVRRAVRSAVFEYHGVSSMDGLRAALEEGAPEPFDEASVDAGPDAEPEPDSEPAPEPTDDDGFVSSDWSPPADQDITRSVRGAADLEAEPASRTRSAPEAASADADGDVDVEALAEQVKALAEQVEYQTDLLEAQQETIEQLVAELRRGR